MFASPLLFDRIGWRGVASVTPNFMLFAGLPFFAGCIAFTFMAGSLAVGPAGMVLFALVMTGAVMQVGHLLLLTGGWQAAGRVEAGTGVRRAHQGLVRQRHKRLRAHSMAAAAPCPQVFSRGAKFSLFKPAEEMVYIGLDDESRTKGKAAIDVVGAQSGKSIGSVLQQALLILR